MLNSMTRFETPLNAQTSIKAAAWSFIISLLQIFDTNANFADKRPSIWEILAFCRLLIFFATASKDQSSGMPKLLEENISVNGWLLQDIETRSFPNRILEGGRRKPLFDNAIFPR
jgi:hypothetical protein